MEVTRALEVDVGTFVRPCLGETRSGDAAVVLQAEGRLFLALIDALGHGDQAHRVAGRAAALLEGLHADDLAAGLRHLHDELRASREAVVAAVYRLDLASGDLAWAAVGNTRARVVGRRPAALATQDGTVGGVFPHLVERRTRLAPGDLLLLSTDGVSERFEVAPTLADGRASEVARKVVHRHGKSHDDAACIAVRCS